MPDDYELDTSNPSLRRFGPEGETGQISYSVAEL